MRASLRALSLAALVSSATSAVAAPSLWDGGLLPEELSGPTEITGSINAALPFGSTNDRNVTALADFPPLWDGGLLPEAPLGSASAATGVAATSHQIDEKYVSLTDAELLAGITASVERDLRAFGHATTNDAGSTQAELEWGALEQLPSPGNLAGLGVPEQNFLELASTFADTIELLLPSQTVAQPRELDEMIGSSKPDWSTEDESVASHMAGLAAAMGFVETRPTDDELDMLPSRQALLEGAQMPTRRFLVPEEDAPFTGGLVEPLAAEVTGAINGSVLLTEMALDGFEDR